MNPVFVRLTGLGGGPIRINLSRALWFVRAGGNGSTTIFFGAYDQVEVLETPEQIMDIAREGGFRL